MIIALKQTGNPNAFIISPEAVYQGSDSDHIYVLSPYPDTVNLFIALRKPDGTMLKDANDETYFAMKSVETESIKLDPAFNNVSVWQYDPDIAWTAQYGECAIYILAQFPAGTNSHGYKTSYECVFEVQEAPLAVLPAPDVTSPYYNIVAELNALTDKVEELETTGGGVIVYVDDEPQSSLSFDSDPQTQIDAISKPNGTDNLINQNDKINDIYLPDYLLGQMLYGGTFAASTGVATLSSNAKTKLGTLDDSIVLTNDATAITGYEDNEGIYYICSDTGTFAGISFVTGDWLLSNGSAWAKIVNTDAVQSVNGKTGAVVLDKTDIGLGNVDNTSDLNKPVSTAQQNAINTAENNAKTYAETLSYLSGNVAIVINGTPVSSVSFKSNPQSQIDEALAGAFKKVYTKIEDVDDTYDGDTSLDTLINHMSANSELVATTEKYHSEYIGGYGTAYTGLLPDGASGNGILNISKRYEGKAIVRASYAEDSDFRGNPTLNPIPSNSALIGSKVYFLTDEIGTIGYYDLSAGTSGTITLTDLLTTYTDIKALSLCTDGTTLYFAGGYNYSAFQRTVGLFSYDPSTGTSAFIIDFTASVYIADAATPTLIYGNGSIYGVEKNATIEVYDITGQTLTTKNASGVTGSLGICAYVDDGVNEGVIFTIPYGSGTNANNYVIFYDADNDQFVDLSAISPSDGKKVFTKFKTINNVLYGGTGGASFNIYIIDIANITATAYASATGAVKDFVIKDGKLYITTGAGLYQYYGLNIYTNLTGATAASPYYPEILPKYTATNQAEPYIQDMVIYDNKIYLGLNSYIDRSHKEWVGGYFDDGSFVWTERG